MLDPAAAPLAADPKRQAHRTIGAYVYQIWQSVYAWVILAEQETLFIEGAEDFDVVDPASAVATQVKDSSRRASLRSQQIQEAISNAWQLIRAEPTREVQYRFLTRAEISVESGNPFGKGIAGLTVWSEIRERPESVRALARFLTRLTSLPRDFRQFLKSATDQKITDEFLAKVHWDTANPQAEFVEAAVEQQLALLGEKLRVPYSDAVAAKAHLFTTLCRVAKQPAERALKRVDLLRAFSEATQVTMSHGEAAELREVARLVAPLLSQMHLGASLALSFADAFPLATQLPPLPSSTLDRLGLVTKLREVFYRSRSLVLHGSTGMGKTTLAKLVLASSATQWRWLSMTGASRSEARGLILDAARHLAVGPNKPIVVVDDVDFSPASAYELEPAIGGLLFQIAACDGAMILTSRKAPPSRLLTGCGIERESVVNVPPLTDDEIVSFMERLGCPADTRRQGWAVLCGIVTRGHPQLVHAYLLNLQKRNWPAVEAQTLAEPSTAVAEEQSQTRQLLVNLSASSREFLFDLSVISAPFRRDHAVAIATSDMPRPGEEFDSLVGPWVEQVGSNYYRVSPLIDRAGEATFSPARLKDVRIAIINALRTCQPLSVLEAATDFRQSWLAKSEPHLIAIAVSLLLAPQRAFKSIAPRVDWFALEGLSAEAVLFASRRDLSRTLRLLQFRLAAETMPKLLPSIFASWHNETHGEGAGAHSLEKCQFATHALTQLTVPLSPTRIFEYLHDIDSVEKGETQFAEMLVNTRRALPRRLTTGANDMVGVLTRVIGSRFRSVEAFDQLLIALTTYAADLRPSILAAWDRVRFDLHTLVDGVWLDVLKRDPPDWQRCLATFDRAFELGGIWNAPPLSIAAIRASTVVRDEYLHDPTGALALLEERAAAQQVDSPYLDDARATVHFNQGRNEKAIECWKRALSLWPESPEPEDRAASFAARLAGRAAARLGRWEEAGEYFLEARQRLKTRRAEEYKTGLLADAGFAFWRAENKTRTIECLISALRLATALPKGKDNLLAFRTRKLLGSIIVWIHYKERGGEPEELSEPQPGMCSELEVHPGFKDLPDNELDLLWLFLGRLECTFDFDSGLHEEILPKIAQSGSPLMPVFREEYYILRALQRADLASLPHLAWDFTRAITQEWEARPDAPCPWQESGSERSRNEFHVTDSHVGAGLFLAALLIVVARGDPFSAIFNQWRQTAHDVPGGGALIAWFDRVETELTSEEPATAILNDGISNWIDVFVVALQVVASRNAAAVDLAFAQFRLVDSLANTPWLLSCAPALGNLFSDGWQRAILLPATLSLPNLSVPAIRAAIGNSSKGIAKPIQILLAGIEAVRLKVPPPMLSRMRIIQSGELHKLRR